VPASGEPETVPLVAPDGQGPPPIAVEGYELLATLGRGGMGVVFKARHVKLKRLVALKMIRTGRLAAAEELARFRTEAEAVARLRHPNVVQVHDVGEHDGCPYLALEFVPGGSLAQKLAAAPLPPAQAAGLVRALAGAMHAAHQANVVHRDLKPANVLLDADGTPKVTDFGLAKALDADDGQTRTGQVMGTPSYMAPEQAAGAAHAIGPATDVWALGAILYECLTGRPPFRAASPLDTLDQVRSRDPVPPRQLDPSVPRDLDTICLKCLQRTRPGATPAPPPWPTTWAGSSTAGPSRPARWAGRSEPGAGAGATRRWPR
jgi:serine/threonine-protein kinase